MAVDRTPELLPQIQSLLVRLGTKAGFSLLSGFADRHGVWELRLAEQQTPSRGFISLACDESARGNLLKCELSAGYVHKDIAERRVVGRFNLKGANSTLDSDQAGVLERTFADAVRQTRPATLASSSDNTIAVASSYAVGK